ncbi:MAG TPA: hypothetical protein VE153_40985 [Myxococcus sp.]|nr:hypothetical protein [Myxococcus sp.]
MLMRGVAAGLVVLLSVSSGPARAQDGRRHPGPAASTQARGTVTTPYVVLHPDTPREVTWFLGVRGPLATGEALTPEEVRALLRAVRGGVPLPEVAPLAGKLGRAERLEAWERRLWEDYLAHLGGSAAGVEAGREDLRPTAEDRRHMALRVALGRLLPALADGLKEEVRPERLLYAVCSSVLVYLGLWAVPEPISKTVAVGVTVVMLVAFGAELLAHLVAEWKALVAATVQARTFAEVKAAGERFGKAVGEDGARVLVVLASLVLGRQLHGVLQKLPRVPPGGPALEAALPGGLSLRLPVPAGPGAAALADGGQVAAVSVVGNRFVVAMAAAAGGLQLTATRRRGAWDRLRPRVLVQAAGRQPGSGGSPAPSQRGHTTRSPPRQTRQALLGMAPHGAALVPLKWNHTPSGRFAST